MDSAPCGVRTGVRESPIGKQFHVNLPTLGKMGDFFRIQTRSLVWTSWSFFYFNSVWEHECYCSSQHFMIFLYFSLFRLQIIHDSACCNSLPWAPFTCKHKSLQSKLVAVMSLESSIQLVNGNMRVAELGIKTLLIWRSSFWWCDTHLSLQHMRFSWCEVVSL